MKTKVALAVLACAIGAGTLLQALGTVSGEIDYYSDIYMQDQVGYWIKDCGTGNWHYGTSTSYWTFTPDGSCSSSCDSGSAYQDVYYFGNFSFAGCVSSSLCDAINHVDGLVCD